VVASIVATIAVGNVLKALTIFPRPYRSERSDRTVSVERTKIIRAIRDPFVEELKKSKNHPAQTPELQPTNLPTN